MADEAVPTNWGRIAGFFLGYMGLFVLALPALLMWLYGQKVGSLDWPPPQATYGFGPEWAVEDGQFRNPGALLGAPARVVDARGVVAGAEAAAASVNPDGSLAAAAVGPGDMGAALGANYRVAERTPLAPGVEAVSTSDGMKGRLLAEPGRALIVLGLDQATADARAAAVASLTRVQIGEAPKVATAGQRKLAYGFLGFWVGLQFFLFGRVASWAGSVPPPAAVPAIPAAELEARLLGLASLDQPFQVTAGKARGELLADWKWYDAKWLDLIRLRGSRRANRLVLRLDPVSKTVRAQDQSAVIDWGAGVDGASLAWKAERGINFFEYQAGREFGIFLQDGKPEVSLTHQWRFDLADMKQPLIRIVRDAGWTWRPVVTFVRAFGG